MSLQYIHLKVVKIVSNKILIPEKKCLLQLTQFRPPLRNFSYFPSRKTLIREKQEKNKLGKRNPQIKGACCTACVNILSRALRRPSHHRNFPVANYFTLLHISL